jgi:uncharacterized repeat protein (TIGR01451 family)
MCAWWLLAVGVIGLIASQANAQRPDEVWSRLEPAALNRPDKQPWVQPAVHRAVRLNPALLRAQLAAAPLERTPAAVNPAQIVLPLPEGGFVRFRVVESPVMAPELAARFPQIKTWLGQGIDDPAMSLRADWTPAGFHAQVISPRGWFYIDPLWRDDDTEYAVYRRSDLGARGGDFICLTPGDDGGGGVAREATVDLLAIGGTLRTYRLACAATGEYTAFHGGTVSAGLAAIVTAINRVTGVYEVELGIRLVLVANNDLLVYTNASTDPYTNNNGSTMLNENQATIDSVIGNANYDIGHVFSTGGGGIAGLRVVCVTGAKARGVTGRSAPTGDAFSIDYVAHEIGHQFGGNHTFNSVTGSCNGNRNASTAYEVGSGSTIMAYAGICGSDNLQPNSDPYFLFASFDEIIAYVTTGSGGSCPVATATGNNPPVVSAGPNFTIPAGTPFALTATAGDPDGDPLTYCWEERDLGAAQSLSDPDNGASPLFRSFNPTTNATRTFPKLSALLNNTASPGEKLPTTARTLRFRVTVRDNRAGGGGVAAADMQLTVTTNAGPFVVTSPNTAVVWSNAQTVTWNPAGTAAAPVNCANVNIRLSADGGNTFPYLLAANTPNDGAELVVLPNLLTSQARIKVEAADNVFFDISNTNFTVVPGTPTPLITLLDTTLTNETCAPGNGAMDPGENVTLSVTLTNAGSGAVSNLVVTLRATNGVLAPGAPQFYGTLAPGGPAVTRPFSFTAGGFCGGALTCVFDLADGTNSLGTVQRTFVLGALNLTSLSRTNSSPIAIPASGNKGPAGPYPSTLSVSNFTGTVHKLTVRLAGLAHTHPDDLDILLVGPGGQKVMLLSDAGGGNAISGVNLVFDDAAASGVPDSAPITSGTYSPTDFQAGDSMNSPAPAGPYGTSLSVFNGTSPNGTWSLYIVDDSPQDTGSLASWSLTFTSSNLVCCSGPALSDLTLRGQATPDPVVVGGQCTFSLVVSNSGPDAAGAVHLTNALPAGAALVSAVASQGTVSNQAGQIVAALGPLAPGSHATLTLTFTATNTGWLTNVAVVGPDALDPDPASNTNALVVTVPVDYDADGLPDLWELAFGLSPTEPADAASDGDGDGLTALEEYWAGTDPADSRNYLGILSVTVNHPDAVIEFPTVTGRSYDVEGMEDWPVGLWVPVATNVPGTGTNVAVTNGGAAAASNRIYRVRLRP